MKITKQATKKVYGDKITFRVNALEDKKIIEYMEKANNGSAFIKEALRFYIIAIEANKIKSKSLQNEEAMMAEVVNAMRNINELNREKKMEIAEDFYIGINELDSTHTYNSQDNDFVYDDAL